MKLFRKRQKLGNRGLSMIELLCSLAIMSILGMVAGSMLIVSANSYQRENADTDAQKEAQLVANQISDLLIDTTAEVKTTSGGVVGGRNRTDELTIVQGTVGYKVRFAAADSKLFYRQFTVDAAGNESNFTSEQLMAENLINFYADVASFKETGNVKLEMVYAKGAGEYPAVFTVTARNKELMAGTAPAIFVSVPTEVILEPNESYNIPHTVNGVSTNLKWYIVDTVSTGTSIDENSGTVTIGSGESLNMFRVKVETSAKDDVGNPLVVKYVRVYVRKVTDIHVNGDLKSGFSCKSGAVYQVTSSITGNNLQKAVGQAFDNNYVDAQAQGAKYTVTPGAGIDESYYSYTSSPTGGVTITLLRDMPEGTEIIVTATARHPLGTDGTNIFNKTGQPYYPAVIDTWVLRKPACALVTAGGWMRRSNEAQATVNQAVIDAVKPAGGRHEVEIMYREYPDGTFQADWLPNIYGDANNSMTVNLRPLLTGALRYDKDYEIRIRLICRDAEGNVVWPTPSTPEDEYIIQSVMKRVSITFDSSMLGLSNATQNDEASAPTLDMKKGQIYGEDGSFLKYNQVIGIDVNGTTFENKITYILEKKVGGSWVACDSSQAWVQNPERQFKMKFEQDGFSGSYRIKIKVVDQEKNSIDETGHLTNEGYEDYILYDETTGNNIFYFNVNQVY